MAFKIYSFWRRKGRTFIGPEPPSCLPIVFHYNRMSGRNQGISNGQSEVYQGYDVSVVLLVFKRASMRVYDKRAMEYHIGIVARNLYNGKCDQLSTLTIWVLFDSEGRPDRSLKIRC